MTEEVIFDFIGARSDITWEIFQFWSGVSFAYLAVGFLAAHRLNWFIVCCLSVLYASVSFVVGEMAMNNFLVLDALTKDLEKLSSKTELSMASQAWLSISNHPIALVLAILGTFLGALFYLPYNFYRSRTEDA